MNKDKRKLSLLLFGIVCMLAAVFAVRSDASAGSVTGYEKITWGISTGRYYVNGIHAFCAQYNKSWPTVGTVVKEIVPCTNDVLRKALYYGYNGPANTLGTDARAHVLTAIAASDANIGESATGASAKYDAFYRDLVNNPSSYPSPPSNFKVYMAITASDAMQNLAFYELEKNGYVTGVKYSSNTQLHNGNACYTLAGAEYGIYANATMEEHTRVGTLTSDASGHMNTLELEAGTYYARENKAPVGFARSSEIQTFTVSPEQTTTLTFTDVPQTNPIDILVRKQDADTGKYEPQGSAKLQGAQFEVQYFAGVWQADVDPVKTWRFRTDEEGIVRYHKDYQIGGDELYDAVPLGTLVIREVKASEGYLRNETTFVRQITGGGDAEHVTSYEAPIVSEKAIEVHVTKYQKDTEQVIPGTVFEHMAPDGSKNQFTTDENGNIILTGLQYGEHTLREQSVMDGYLIKEAVYTFTIDEQTAGHLEIKIYNEPAPYDVMIRKTDDYGNRLKGAEFTIYEDKECRKEVKRGVTDENGILCMTELEVGKVYYLKETKAPTGYEIAEGVQEIYVTSIPVKDEFICYLNGEQYEQISGTKANREVHIKIKNEVGYVLPQTGTSQVLLMQLAGAMVCVMSLYLRKKEKKS